MSKQAMKLAEIDELREKLADHKAARIAYASEFPKDAEGEPDVGNIHANIRVLKAKLAALEVMYLNSLADATQWQLYKSRKDAVIAAGMGKKALRDSAAGTTANTQNPIAWEYENEGGVKFLTFNDPDNWHNHDKHGFKNFRALTYTAAGAAPVQQEPEPIQVCRLMKKEEGIWVAASEFYAGHPDQKWVKLVSTNPGSWSIQRRVTGKQIADGLAKALAGTPPALAI